MRFGPSSTLSLVIFKNLKLWKVINIWASIKRLLSAKLLTQNAKQANSNASTILRLRSTIPDKLEELLENSGDSEYIKNFNDLLSPFGLSVSTLTETSPSVIGLAVENKILEGVRRKTSLSTVPLTGSFWKPSPHLSEGFWSCMITRFDDKQSA